MRVKPQLFDRLHPENLRELRQLVRLHGAPWLIAAIKEIAAREARENARDKLHIKQSREP